MMGLFGPTDLITGNTYAPTYYAATLNAQPDRPPLRGRVNCDICVVGAGFAGISTALHLAERGYKVVVLEAVRVGYGASGRNGGQIINGYSRDDAVIRARYGSDAADALLAMSHEGGDIIRERIAKYDIKCALKTGAFFAAFTEAQMDDLKARAANWAKAGNNTLRLLDRAETQQVVGTDLYCGGLLDMRGGHIHPLNLVAGEAVAFEHLGGVIYENSRVTGVDTGAHPVVRTAEGEVHAKQVVVCGNAYLGGVLPRLSGRIMAVSSQIVTTEVLGADVTDKMLPQDYSVEDCNFLLDYYRITEDKRLLFGGGVVYSGADPADIRKRLYPHIIKTFPQLEGVKLDYAWSGHFALTLTRLPHVGQLSDTVYFIQGDSGHGVTTTHLLGRLTAEAIAGDAARYGVFAGMRNYPFPGGRMFRVPLTALGAWYYGLREKLGV